MGSRSALESSLDAEDLWVRDPVTGQMRGNPIEYLNELEAAIESTLPGPLRAARTFFFELDRRTENALAPVTLSPARLAAYRSAVKGAMSALVRRFDSRFAGTGRPTPADPALRQDIGHFSSLIRRLARASFPASSAPASSAIDIPALSTAFERFANGNLRLFLPGAGTWSTQPSSGFFFYFAELGFCALDLDLDAPFWEPLLPTLVATQLVFGDLYAPDPAEVPCPDQIDYHPRWYRPERRWSTDRLQALRARFRSKGVAQLDAIATEHARTAFPGHAPPSPRESEPEGSC